MIDVRDLAATAFHHNLGQKRNWNAEPETLEILADLTEPEMVTVETGAGASTVVFAAAGCHHTAISPHAREHVQIRNYCADLGLDTGLVTFVADRSENALPRLTRRVDLGFIDGNHSFPHPAVDFLYIARLLRARGVLVLDDVPIPSVGMVYRHLADDPNWELDEIVGDRAVVIRKVQEFAP